MIECLFLSRVEHISGNRTVLHKLMSVNLLHLYYKRKIKFNLLSVCFIVLGSLNFFFQYRTFKNNSTKNNFLTQFVLINFS